MTTTHFVYSARKVFRQVRGGSMQSNASEREYTYLTHLVLLAYMFLAKVQFRRTTQNSCELPLHTVFAPHSRCSGRCEEVRCSRTTPHWSTLEYTYPTHLVLSAHRFVEKVQYSHTGSCVWETRLLRCIVLACSVYNSCCLYI